MLRFAIEDPEVVRREKGALHLGVSYGKVIGFGRALFLTTAGGAFSCGGVLFLGLPFGIRPFNSLGYLLILLLAPVMGAVFTWAGMTLFIRALFPVVEMHIRRNGSAWEVTFRRQLLSAWRTTPVTKRLEGIPSVYTSKGRGAHQSVQIGTETVANFYSFSNPGDAGALKADLESLL